MPHFEEGNLGFEFDDRQWRVLKFDDHPDYRKRMEKVDETKAVDFVGVLNEQELFLIEVKDFRQHRIETKEKLSSGELAVELAQKTRDSIACMVGAYHTSSTPGDWQPFTQLLCNKDKQVKVALWLEHDLPQHSQQRKKVLASVQTKLFKPKLAWLTRRVLVCGSQKEGLPGLRVSNLPR